MPAKLPVIIFGSGLQRYNTVCAFMKTSCRGGSPQPPQNSWPYFRKRKNEVIQKTKNLPAAAVSDRMSITTQPTANKHP